MILVLVDPLASPELIIYNLSEGGYYLPTIKSPNIVKNELEILRFNSTIINSLEDLKRLSNCKVVVEFTFDIDDAITIREIAIKNNLVVCLVVLKSYYDERTVDQLKYVCSGIMLVEAEKIGERFVYRFAIPKMIGGLSMASYIRYKTEKSTLEVDTSRDIV